MEKLHNDHCKYIEAWIFLLCTTLANRRILHKFSPTQTNDLFYARNYYPREFILLQ